MVTFLIDDTYRWVCDHNYVILQTKRARCTLNKEILDSHNEESFSGVHSVELVYKFDEKLASVCQPLLKCHSNSFGGQIHIYSICSIRHRSCIVATLE